MNKLVGRAALLTAVLSLAIAGCAKKQASLPPPQSPMVAVANPVVRNVTEYEYFTGRTEASEMVEIRARVSGYLTFAPLAKSEAKKGEVEIAWPAGVAWFFSGCSVHASFRPYCREGDDVGKDKPLFEIDRRTFEAEKERAEANIKQYEALTDTLERNYRTAVRSGSGVSQLDLIKITGDLAQAKANVLGAKAASKTADINLKYTSIKAPFEGRLSRRYVDPGNLVKADETILTTIVKLDPIHAYFDVDERTVLRFRELLKLRQVTSAREAPLKVHLALANESKYQREGYIDFVDNRLEPGTGTLRIRVELPNPKVGNSFYYLSPGMFIRLRLPVGKEHEAQLVPESALASKQGQKVVYVVRSEPATDTDGDPAYTKAGTARMVERVYEVPVEPGQLEEDNWRVVKPSGSKEDQAKGGPGAPAGNVFKPGDRIVTSGLQRVRDKGEVRLAPPKKKGEAASAK